jgi:ribosomal protein L11 methyltransferase
MLCLDPDNPFATQPRYTTLTVRCSEAAAPLVELLFEEDALSVTAFEKEKGAYWQVEVLLMDDAVFSAEKQAALEAIEGVDSHELTTLEMRDWVLENQKDFPPLEIGSFYIHGSHLPAKEGSISLEIDAGRAFGTGEHATTALCLQALEALAQQPYEVKKLADIGCGTGILALAAKRLWPESYVIGGDMDAPSVETAIENAEKNGMAGLPFVAAAGTGHPHIQEQAPYDVLVANILAGPLIELAADLTAVVREEGVIVLSGLLTRQEEEVLAAYEAQAWKADERLRHDEWSALVLRRG